MPHCHRPHFLVVAVVPAIAVVVVAVVMIVVIGVVVVVVVVVFVFVFVLFLLLFAVLRSTASVPPRHSEKPDEEQDESNEPDRIGCSGHVIAAIHTHTHPGRFFSFGNRIRD